MMEHGICPGCGRHCDLTNPHCERGEAYLRAGSMPQSEKDQGDQENRNMDDRLIDALRDLSRMMRAQYEGRASQNRILIILKESGPLTQRDLTERLAIQPGSASEILAKLENMELIARTQNAEDRRTTDVQLTALGRTLAEEAAGQRRERHTRMFSCLSEEEKHTLLALMEKLCADWSGQYHEAGGCRGGHEHHKHCGRHSSHEDHRRHGRSGWRERG